MGERKKALVLSAGGIDSTTAMAIAREGDYELYSLSFHYGQRHALELGAAERVAKALGAIEYPVLHMALIIRR